MRSIQLNSDLYLKYFKIEWMNDKSSQTTAITHIFQTIRSNEIHSYATVFTKNIEITINSITHTLLHSYLLYFTSLIPNYYLFLFTNLSTNDSCIKFLH